MQQFRWVQSTAHCGVCNIPLWRQRWHPSESAGCQGSVFARIVQCQWRGRMSFFLRVFDIPPPSLTPSLDDCMFTILQRVLSRHLRCLINFWSLVGLYWFSIQTQTWDHFTLPISIDMAKFSHPRTYHSAHSFPPILFLLWRMADMAWLLIQTVGHWRQVKVWPY